MIDCSESYINGEFFSSSCMIEALERLIDPLLINFPGGSLNLDLEYLGFLNFFGLGYETYEEISLGKSLLVI